MYLLHVSEERGVWKNERGKIMKRFDYAAMTDKEIRDLIINDNNEEASILYQGEISSQDHCNMHFTIGTGCQSLQLTEEDCYVAKTEMQLYAHL